MNFCINVSRRMQTKISALALATGVDLAALPERKYLELQAEALEMVKKEDPRVQAEGDVRIGDIILLVDSDTRVPEDCLIYAANEMALYPEV